MKPLAALLVLAVVVYVIGIITYLNPRYEMGKSWRCDAGKVG